MAKVVKLDNGQFQATLSQEELTTIALLLGYNNDSIVLDCADDWEIPSEVLCVGDDATNLYQEFWSKVEHK
ncbi:hypothetical protein Bcp1_160 [Bacillus phage Bcp1]|uniref:Uncharacterized protein n=1 Tax=Bacillus phage Bcp1 TaxID=584892 RepID=X2JLB8_9CAUD|nr:hypothetical protein Bcp1_160 [Bacillus phage Bcp1]AHN66635.1 hypothetical protein Bcp1_160 [Bacillus phage Bcp1]AXQ67649.1 hypothetical protein KIOSHI_166 [Bacillus phage Kioshi]